MLELTDTRLFSRLSRYLPRTFSYSIAFHSFDFTSVLNAVDTIPEKAHNMHSIYGKNPCVGALTYDFVTPVDFTKSICVRSIQSHIPGPRTPLAKGRSLVSVRPRAGHFEVATHHCPTQSLRPARYYCRKKPPSFWYLIASDNA